MKFKVTIEFDEQDLKNPKVEIVEVKTKDEKKTPVGTYSMYARFFDESSPVWQNDAEYNLAFLKIQQNHANEMLKARGYVFLNEVYDMLGIPRTRAGQVVGWMNDYDNPHGDNYIDFGIFNDGNEEFVNGYKKSILLDFNVDGNILVTLEEEET